MFLVQLVVALLWLDRRRRSRTVNAFDGPITVLLCACTVSTVLLTSPWGNSQTVWATVNLVVAGVCAGLAYLRWAAHFASLGIRSALACLFVAYLISAFYKMALDFVPSALGAVMASVLPMVSVVSLRSATIWGASVSPGFGEALYTKGSYRSLVWVAMCVFVFRCVGQVAADGVPVVTSYATALVSHGIEIAVAAGVLGWVFVCKRSLDFTQLWCGAFALLASGIAIESTTLASVAGGFLLEVATTFVWMLTWLLVCDVAHNCDLHPYVVCGLGWGAYMGGNYAGMLVGYSMGIDGFSASVSVGLLWVLGIALAALLGTRVPDIQRVFAGLHPQVRPEEYRSVDERCDRMGAEVALSPRELEVFKLIAKGRSRAFIAEELCLSENTVRGHTSRLYGKLGVHTRDELQRLVGL